MTLSRKFLGACSFLILISFNGCSQKQPDIHNLSFEQDMSIFGVKNDWRTSGCTGGQLIRDTLQAKEGMSSGRIQVFSCNTSKAIPFYAYQLVRIPDHIKEIEISFWTKNEKLNSAQFKCIVLDASERPVNIKDTPLYDSREWTQLTNTLENRSGQMLYVEFAVGEQSKLWLDDLVIKFDGKNYYQYQKDDVTEDATTKPSKVFSITPDLSEVVKQIASRKVIGIGESSHGVHEMSGFRNRLIKELIEKKKCRLVILEAPEPFGIRLNQYVQGVSNEAITSQDIGVQFFNLTEEVLELVTWIRDYNKTTERKVVISGMDVSFEWFKILANTIERERGNGYFKDFNRYYTMSQADSMLYFLSTKRDLIVSSTRQSFFDSLYYVTGKCHQANSAFSSQWNHKVRDSIMAQNVIQLTQQYTRDAEKVVVYAHLGHLNKQFAGVSLSSSVGRHLSDHFGKQYFVLALLVGVGDYQNSQLSREKLNIYPLCAPVPGSLEYQLSKVSDKPFFLDIQHEAFFNKVMLYRTAGGMERDNHFFPGNPSKRFDAVAYFPRGTPLHLLFSLYKETSDKRGMK